MRNHLSLYTLFLLSMLTSCGTTQLTSKIDAEKGDTFREESFLRYTSDRLQKLENTPYTALAKCHEGDTKEGLKELQQQTQKQKKNPEFWNQVGMCYFLQRDMVKAEYFFQFSLDMTKRKDFAPALNNLGTIKLKQGHYEMALSYFQKATSKVKLKVPLFNQAQIYLQFNLLDKAQTILEALNAQNYKDPDILLGLGSVYLMQGDTKRSLQTLKTIPTQYQDREDVTLMRALGLYEEKRIPEVYELLKDYNFTHYVPLKRSARSLEKLVRVEMKKIEEAQKLRERQKKENELKADGQKLAQGTK